MTNDKHVDVAHARTDQYQQVLAKIAEDDSCPAPFCKERAEYHVHPVDETAKHWKVTQNSWNYQNAMFKFLLIYKPHVSDFTDVSAEAWVELRCIVNELVSKFNIQGATLMMRFGEKSHTGATVTHLHAHLIVGYPRADGGESILGMVAYGPALEKKEE